MPFNDLREFIDAARALGQVKEIHGAHWNLEIGALTELFAFKEPSPLVLFDRIPDHNPNFRVAANLINTPARSGLDRRHARRRGAHRTRRALERIVKEVRPIPPRVLSSGPILENVKTGDEIDMTIFPTPHWHELDGGRYIGTADCVITGEPEEGGWVNVGIYRVQVHNKNTLGLYVSPGHHARIMREKYLGKGQELSGRRDLRPGSVALSCRRPIDRCTACPSSTIAAACAALPWTSCAVISPGYRFRPRPRSPSKARCRRPGASAHGGSVWRMAGLLRSWRGQRAGDPGQKTLLSQQPDLVRRAAVETTLHHLRRTHRRGGNLELSREGRRAGHQRRVVLRRRIGGRRRRAVYRCLVKATLSRSRSTSRASRRSARAPATIMAASSSSSTTISIHRI